MTTPSSLGRVDLVRRPRTAGTSDFGTLKNVCQPGDATGATAQGVTDDEIRVATFSDPGFSGRPGLNQELFDSGEVFAEWCNDQGGINGRKIVVDYRDAALTELPGRASSTRAARTSSWSAAVRCSTTPGVKDRLECMLPDLAGLRRHSNAHESDLLHATPPQPTGRDPDR